MGVYNCYTIGMVAISKQSNLYTKKEELEYFKIIEDVGKVVTVTSFSIFKYQI